MNRKILEIFNGFKTNAYWSDHTVKSVENTANSNIYIMSFLMDKVIHDGSVESEIIKNDAIIESGIYPPFFTEIVA